jgi:hypothetical protein
LPLKKARYTEEQIAFALHQAETGPQSLLLGADELIQ